MGRLKIEDRRLGIGQPRLRIEHGRGSEIRPKLPIGKLGWRRFAGGPGVVLTDSQRSADIRLM
jgi:hypothetical protein